MAPRVFDLYDSYMPLAPPGSATELAAIAERFGLADVYVFGSRAGAISSATRRSDTRRSGSDVDIAVRPNGARLLAPHDRVELTIELERVLHTSPVDLLVLPEAGPFLALAAIRGNLLYRADSVDQAEYELFVLRRAGDLAPLERERQQIVLDGGR